MATQRRIRTNSRGNLVIDSKWIEVQAKTFTNWINERLKGTEHHVADIKKDFVNGVILVKLLEVLSGGKRVGKYKLNPKTDVQMRGNLDVALRFLVEEEKIPLINIGAGDIQQGNIKLILGLLWKLIMHYQISDAQRRASAKKLLLGWVNASLPLNGVKNFTTDWNDGRNLSTLVDYCKPGLIPDHASLDPNNALDNITKAMDLAKKELDVPQVLLPEDLAIESPDELSVMTYISGFCHPGQTTLMGWINAQIPDQPTSNFTTDWSDGKRLNSLVHSLSGGMFPIANHPTEEESALTACQEAMDAAESILEISKTISPEDFADENLDQLTRVTYLAQFQHAKLHISSIAATLQVSGHGVTCDSIERETTFIVSGAQVPDWSKLEAIVTLNDGEELPVECQITDDNEITFLYTPQEVGIHTVDVRLSGFPLPGSPFRVAIVDASKCVVSSFPEGRLQALATYTINVDTSEAGCGEPKALANTVSGSDCGCVIEDTGEGMFVVTITPTEVGPLEVEVEYGNTAIPGSPFRFTVNDPTKLEMNRTVIESGSYQVKKPIEFSVSAQNAGEGDISASISTPSGVKAEFEVKEQGGDTYVLSYVPVECGSHAINIMLDGNEVFEVPISIFVAVGCFPENINVTLPTTGELGSFIIDQSYDYKVDTTGAGEGKLIATSHGARTDKKPKVTVSDQENGHYTVSVEAKKPDMYMVNIQWGEEDVPGSPFSLSVEDKPRLEKVVCNGPHYEVGSSDPITLDVNTENAGAGKLHATCLGKEVGSVPTEITEKGPKKYLVSVTPPNSDIFTITIKFNGRNVPKSPFIVNNLPKCELVRINEEDMFLFSKVIPLGTTAEFRILTKEAGPGTLNLETRGPGKAEVNVVDSKGGTYTCEFNPSVAGKYLIDIIWNDDYLEGSPYTLTYVPDAPLVVPGLGFENENLRVGIPYRFKLHCGEVGDGKFEILANPPTSANVRYSTIAGSSSYQCEIVPLKPGDHQILIEYDGRHILGSPFTIQFKECADASKCRMLQDASENQEEEEEEDSVHFVVSTEGAGKGSLTATVENATTAGMVPVTVTQISDNRYTIVFSPTDGTEYILTVKYDGQNIPGSPFNLDIESVESNPDEEPEEQTTTFCRASGDGLIMCTLGEWANFTVDTSDAGPGELNVTIKNGGYTVEPRISAVDEDNKVKVEYIPNKLGKYTVSLQWGGEGIPGSPFSFECYEPTRVENNLSDEFVGTPLEFVAVNNSRIE